MNEAIIDRGKVKCGILTVVSHLIERFIILKIKPFRILIFSKWRFLLNSP